VGAEQEDAAEEQNVQWSQWGAYTDVEYPSESWIETCRKEFPAKGVATLEEARVRAPFPSGGVRGAGASCLVLTRRDCMDDVP
jgi:hypothetical protein